MARKTIDNAAPAAEAPSPTPGRPGVAVAVKRPEAADPTAPSRPGFAHVKSSRGRMVWVRTTDLVLAMKLDEVAADDQVKLYGRRFSQDAARRIRDGWQLDGAQLMACRQILRDRDRRLALASAVATEH